MNKKLLMGLSLATACGAANLHAAGDPAAGKEKSESCAGCHGEDGNSNAPIFPKLAAQKMSYLSKQLYDFKSSARPEPTMSAMAETMSDADIADLSAYFAQQTVQVESSDPNERGKQIYHGGIPADGVPACSGCHGPAGQGNEPAAYPALRGQFAAYLSKTLHDFRTKSRYNDSNEIMRTIAARLSEEEINAVSDYLSGLK